MSLQLFAHPFSSYCWKVLIALYENEVPFAFRQLGPDQPENEADWIRYWPLRKMPVLLDRDAAGNEQVVVQTSAIIEHLQLFHPGAVRLIPDEPRTAVEVRMLERVFDDYVMTPMNKLVGDALRPADARDPFGTAEARATLDKAYAWLDRHLVGGAWTAGDAFTLADCAAAPSLFYADWAHPIPAGCATLREHRARLNARPSVVRCIEAARPFRSFFPLGAPDRD